MDKPRQTSLPLGHHGPEGESPVAADRQVERVLNLSEERFRQLFEQNPAGVVVEDPEGRIIECNKALADLLGYGQEELRGQLASLLFHDPRECLARRERALAGEAICNEEIRLLHKEGHAVWVLDNAVLVPAPLNGKGQVLRTVLDITERKLVEQGLERMAYRDTLTGLPNRRMLEIRADQALAEAYRRGGRVALVFMDLIGFKRINDELGHRAGDEVIVHVARRLEGALRRTDSVTRFGGDEFVVLLSGVEDAERAEQIARRLLDHVASPVELDGTPVEVEARAGVALYPEEGLDLATLLKAADRALTEAKRQGGPAIVMGESKSARVSPP